MKLQEAIIKFLILVLALNSFIITKASPLPTASFTIPSTAFVGEPVIADGSNSINVNGQAGWSTKTFADGRSPVLWNFGDNLGTYSTPKLLKSTHVYMTAGTYTVSLTVKDSTGASSSTSQTITILDIPTATGGNSVALTDQGNNSANCTALQNALNTAYANNTTEREITLPKITYTCVLNIPNTAVGNKYVTLRPTDTSFLPSQTSRINPSIHSTNMPKIASPGVDQTQLTLGLSTKYLKIVGIEFNKQAGHIYSFIDIGQSVSNYSQMPHHIIIDRCYFKGNTFDDTNRSIYLTADSFSIINSYIKDMHAEGFEAQGIAGFAGSGLGIVNNYIEGYSQNILFGGSDAGIKIQSTASSGTSTTAVLTSVSNLRVGDGISFVVSGTRGPWSATVIRNISGNNITFDTITNSSGTPTAPDTTANAVKYGASPQNIVIARNYMPKNLIYRVGDPLYNGSYGPVVKNTLELKHAMLVVIDGNFMENNWGQQGQAGPTILLTPRNQTCYTACTSQNNPWTMVRDVQFNNNRLKNIPDFFNILGTDNLNQSGTDESGPSAYVQYVLLENNFIERVDPTGLLGSNGDIAFVWPGVKNLTINHNTQINISGNRLIGTETSTSIGPVSNNVLFINNISKHLTYGFAGTGGIANSFVTTHWPDGFAIYNVLSDDENSIGPNAEVWTAPRTMPNYFPATINTNTFIDLAGGNPRLKSTSPYKAGNATPAADGLDIGMNFDTILNSTSGAITGIWTASSSPTKCNWHTLNVCN